MPRVDLIQPQQAPLPVRSFFAAGDPGALTASVAQVPELLVAIGPFLRAIYGPSALAMRLKEIVILRVSARMGCRYCVQTHSAVALGAGLSHDEIRALRADDALPGFSDPRERLLLRWADALAPGPAPITDELAASMTRTFAQHEVVEISMVAGATMMLNRYATGLELPASKATLDKITAEGLL
ncbi:MAG TPA: carboxymuconolactone decarboxylase family protein [Kofleriaceae bacterium]|nr:carboxymuconolactone decarboxylase family protein [Kofleriaceae bacterium]